MDNEIEITASDSKGLVGKIKDWSYENWQTILVILIVLIVGISAYNYNQQDNGTENNSVAVISENENSENEDNNAIAATEEEKEIVAEDNDEQEAEINDNTTVETKDNDVSQIIEDDQSSNDVETEENEAISSTNENGKNYTITASYGEGITHLARYALNEYLQENNVNADLNQEQKIYVEDYMQNRKGDNEIEIGHQETFSEGLIEEAISKANNLSYTSIENLKKYIK
ncbi:MAG: hypothetical protein KAI71_06485 [Candidatus Pacebacteria bacterium]|nr:hypothetical protein [Candidatus Paceibacterota bacterium]